MRTLFPIRVLITSLFMSLLVFTAWGQKANNEHRVYEFVVESVTGSMDDVAEVLSDAALATGWETLASTDVGVPGDCVYGARVVIMYNPGYASQLLDINRETAPFALVDRINLFEDEKGLHISIVNPHSINRTVLMDDVAYTDLTESHRQALRSMIVDAVDGTESSTAYGQKRKKGHIGKTMFVMAGGKFSDKIQEKLVIPGGNLQDVAAKVKEGLSQPGL